MNVVIVEKDPFIRENLADCIARAGFADFCSVQEKSNDISGVHMVTLDGQIRLGALLDRIQAVHDYSKSAAKTIIIGPFALDPFLHVLTRGDENLIRLTEKESVLLQILNDARGATVSRSTLLDKAWGYADGVETHTLETHIYRLRQKIEDDPAEPQIIMTDESDGYRLNLD